MADTPEKDEVRVTECSECGDVCECLWAPDPFAEEIRGDDTPRWMCDFCRWQSNREI